MGFQTSFGQPPILLVNQITLPNLITIARIIACPIIVFLVVSPDLGARFWAFVLFVAAGLSDVWDGYLARRYDMITDTGKLLDPIADKLLLVSTFFPLFIVSQRGDLNLIPWWGALPLWVILLVFGRELFITFFRVYAATRGVVIPAGRAGKRKTLLQNLFIGGILLWYPLSMLAGNLAWNGWVWLTWAQFHGAWVGITLWLAIVLTIYSMFDYLWAYRSVVGIRR